jgi:iron complex outermembrane receptor protein
MKNSVPAFPRVRALAAAVAVLGAPLAVAAAEDDRVEEIVVQGSLRSLPGENVESVFGFSKSLLELPRSASTVSSEQIERFGINDLDELIVLAPGSFTQSFFGVAGSLDVRRRTG